MEAKSWEDNHDLWNCLTKDPLFNFKLKHAVSCTKEEFLDEYKHYLKNRDLPGSIDFMYELSGVAKAVDLQTGEINYFVLDIGAMRALIWNINEAYSEATDKLGKTGRTFDFPFIVNQSNVIYSKGKHFVNLNRVFNLYKRVLENKGIKDRQFVDLKQNLENIILSTRNIDKKVRKRADELF